MNSLPFNIDSIRAEFPILHQQVNGHRLAFLDNAASSQRPDAVIDAVSHYYRNDHANVHRGVHHLSHRATDAYEGAREKIRAFINARSIREIVFTSGTTESINLLANSLGQTMQAGDEVIVSRMEHHSNIVPWKLLAERIGIVIKVAPINEQGELVLDELAKLFSEKTKLLAIAHVSNALGTINPVADIVALAKQHEVPVLLDGAQAVPHSKVDVQAIDCDFYAFSSHKMCGPTGIGVLYARESLLENMPLFMGGGEMVISVSFEKTIYNDLPYRFEAGTPPIAQAIGLGAAIDYLEGIGMDNIAAYEHQLLELATTALSDIDGLRIIGTAAEKAAVISFVFDDIHPHDLGTVLDHQGVAIRTGHHCANPVMDFFGVPGTARASLAFYNDAEDIEQLVKALHVAVGMFR
ncbi:MAG: cysteine desulfurase/selenocysteine lyase [Gammaproteobacteria bacterium]|jgi:cysteine desulfurase/selenocysteine lyase